MLLNYYSQFHVRGRDEHVTSLELAEVLPIDCRPRPWAGRQRAWSRRTSGRHNNPVLVRGDCCVAPLWNEIDARMDRGERMLSGNCPSTQQPWKLAGGRRTPRRAPRHRLKARLLIGQQGAGGKGTIVPAPVSPWSSCHGLARQGNFRGRASRRSQMHVSISRRDR